VVLVQQELFMLSASQEIYSRRVRLVFQNRGKLFDAQYRALAFRLLINIDRDVLRVGRAWADWPPISLVCNEPPGLSDLALQGHVQGWATFRQHDPAFAQARLLKSLRVSYLAQTRKPAPAILHSVECADRGCGRWIAALSI